MNMKNFIVFSIIMIHLLSNAMEQKYFYSLTQTAHTNDEDKCVLIQRPFFIQLCVQASKEHSIDRQPFVALLNKIKTEKINIHTEIITLTQKDCEHRLLSYIPSFEAVVGTCIIVNDKSIWPMFQLKTRKKPIVRKLHDNISDDMPNDIKKYLEDDFFGSCSCWDLEYTGQKELKAQYDDFEKDKEHHAKIVTEFEELLNS